MYVKMRANRARCRYFTLVCSVLVLPVVFSLIGNGSSNLETINDIHCLRSIRESLEDPSGHLRSWNFSANQTLLFFCNFSGVGCWRPNDLDYRVREIRLSNMGLRGQFPLGLESCTHLEALNFSFNKLSGPIPSEIATYLPFISTLDLSHNHFSGGIPSNIADCSNLRVLKLNDNQLYGHIPPRLGQLTLLTTFTFANNRLAEPLPMSVSANFANNQKPCTAPLIPCKHRTFFENVKDGFVVGYGVFAIFATSGFVTYYCSICLYLKKGKKKAKQFPLRKNNQPKEVNCLVKMWPQYEVLSPLNSLLKFDNTTEEFDQQDTFIASAKNCCILLSSLIFKFENCEAT